MKKYIELFMSDIIIMGPLYVGHICGQLHICLQEFLGNFFQSMSGGVSTTGAEGTLFVSTFSEQPLIELCWNFTN